MHVITDRFAVGQNVFHLSSREENIHDYPGMVRTWYDEVADFNKNEVSSYM